MKRRLITKPFRQTLLAVPAAALMLGAAHAGTFVGLNFQDYYYAGAGAGYQTTGFPVTAPAFGVPAANWTSSAPLSCGRYGTGVPISMVIPFGPSGTLSANVSAPGAWQSGIGENTAAWVPVTVPPGNDEVTWGILDDGSTYIGGSGGAPSVAVSGLAAVFPNGYVIQTIAAYKSKPGAPAVFANVDFTDGTTTTICTYTNSYFVQGTVADGYGYGDGTVGLSDPSGTFTANTININPEPQSSPDHSVLAGFIITDEPVVTHSAPAYSLVASGSPFVLSATAIGIGTLSYQWQHEGTNIPGAIYANYTNASASFADKGSYQVVVSSSAFPGVSVTGDALDITIPVAHPAETSTWDAVTTTPGAQDGSGTWSYGATNWWNGTLDDYWGQTDSAIFGVGGTGSYMVTLGDYISANSITFASGGYTITNTTSESLTLNSGGIAANGAATIAAPLSTGTNALVKTGTGYLTLSGAATFPSATVLAGALEVDKVGADAPYVVTNGATLELGYSTSGGYANTAMQLYGSGVSSPAGLYIAGGKIYNVSGGLVVEGAPTTIRQFGSGMGALGIFDINSTPGLSITALASGSVIDTNVEFVSDGYGMSMTTVPGANTATGDLVMNGPLNIKANTQNYGLYKYGSGSVRLNAAATATNAGVHVQAGTLICGAPNCIGTNGTLAVAAAGTVNFNNISQTVANVVTSGGAQALFGTLMMTINKGGSPSSCTLTTLDANPLILGGTLQVTNIGGSLAIGDKFTLFSAPNSGLGGSFTTLKLPALPDGLAWQDNTGNDGSISVVKGSVPPSITTDLSGGTNFTYVGGSAFLSIAAAGDPILTYTWKNANGTVVGANGPTLDLGPLTISSSGFYYCMVTNDYGVANSQTNYIDVLTPSAYAAAVVADGPLDFWPLNETNGSTAYDYVNQNNGALQGGLTLDVPGPVPPADPGFSASNTAYLFDGYDSYVSFGTGPAVNGSANFSLEAWVNTTGASTADIIGQRAPGNYNGEYELQLTTNGEVYFYIYGGSAYQFSITTTNIVNDGKWHHIAAVRNGGTGSIYIDGKLSASATGSAEPLDPTISVFLGADERDAKNYLSGTLADVAIYGYALTAAQIAHQVAAAVAPPLTLAGRSLIWSAGTLESTPVLGASATWAPVSGATSPYPLPISGASQAMFYRLKY